MYAHIGSPAGTINGNYFSHGIFSNHILIKLVSCRGTLQVQSKLFRKQFRKGILQQRNTL